MHTTRTPFRRLLPLLALLPLAACALHRPALRLEGDAERAAVLAVVDRTFEAIEAATPAEGEAIWREVLLDAGSMSWVMQQDGARVAGSMSYAEHFAKFDDAPPANEFLERYWDPVVLVEGDIAMVWAPYDFFLDRAFSHGGVDVITLLRTEGGWKIASLTWTVDFEPVDSPLGPPVFEEREG